jgi:hypothetical protein
MPRSSAQVLTSLSAEDPRLPSVIHQLRDLYRPAQIYLFGSAARGDPGPDTDYDLMVVIPDDTPMPIRDSGRAYRAVRRLGVATDVLVWSHSEFESRLHLKASLPATICRTGTLVYPRGHPAIKKK